MILQAAQVQDAAGGGIDPARKPSAGVMPGR